MDPVMAITTLTVLAMFCITTLAIAVLGKPQTAKAAFGAISKALKILEYIIWLWTSKRP